MSVQSIPWVVIVVFLPLIAALASLIWPRRAAPLVLVTAIAIVASVAGLVWQVAQEGVLRYSVGGWGAPLGIDLYVDGLSLLMLMTTAVIGLGVSIYASGYFADERVTLVWPLWMLLWAALNALFVTADIFNIYVTLEMLALAAVALIALARTPNALSGAMRYLLVSLVGSLAYLFGAALLYHSAGTVDIALLAKQVEPSPAVWAALGMITAGLLLKSAIFPLHFWLPSAHASAPAPVSAVLSALVVKASLYVLLRLWLNVFPPNAVLGQFLGLLGAGAVLWGGLQALRQTRLKMLIAYSTVSQLGYLLLAFPLAVSVAWQGALYLLVSHALAKSAMFMAAGNILTMGGHDRIALLGAVARRLPLTMTAFALAGVSIMGLPPSGGFIGKWLLLEGAMRSGQWGWVAILIIGGLLAAAYVFKVIGYGFLTPNGGEANDVKPVPGVMQWSALCLALMAVFLGLFATGPLALLQIGMSFGEQGGER